MTTAEMTGVLISTGATHRRHRHPASATRNMPISSPRRRSAPPPLKRVLGNTSLASAGTVWHCVARDDRSASHPWTGACAMIVMAPPPRRIVPGTLPRALGRWVTAFLLLAFATVLAAMPALAQSGTPAPRRLALVIGNQDYRHVPRLQNPVADARAKKVIIPPSISGPTRSASSTAIPATLPSRRSRTAGIRAPRARWACRRGKSTGTRSRVRSGDSATRGCGARR